MPWSQCEMMDKVFTFSIILYIFKLITIEDVNNSMHAWEKDKPRASVASYNNSIMYAQY